MAEYIEREALIAEILKGTINTSVLYGMDVASGMDIALEYVKSIPAAEVEPVRQGRWLLDGRCSECHENPLTTHRTYCPNCGVKMDLEVSE